MSLSQEVHFPKMMTEMIWSYLPTLPLRPAAKFKAKIVTKLSTQAHTVQIGYMGIRYKDKSYCQSYFFIETLSDIMPHWLNDQFFLVPPPLAIY